ncbi:alpha/beta hydrolase [Sulfitobacter sp. 1151]|uniref:Alpha/beta hydrolase n=2 Tax=Parasulfitobacter algicola TaxID=2614809 RepID=A0ABX2IRP3_9RHOB|nr:alpha/beta hydrolase [Sulfitobacter algicola]
MRSTASSALREAPHAESFFDGFVEHKIDIQNGQIFCRIAGNGPVILLLHGYPQTSAMWHKVAPVLAKSHTVICADLRGYGRSFKPETDAVHSTYSKRAMANDMMMVMNSLGIETFFVGAHDRGARVAHRLAADHPERVMALATLDIAPTREMYRDGDSSFAQAYWHWYWLTQSYPFPETLIAGASDYYWLKKCGSGSAGLSPFSHQALKEYLTCFADPDVIHASCEDYRAAATIDIEHDNDDCTRLKMPVLALWGKHGVIERHFDCLTLWRERADDVRGWSIDGGHYLAEEKPGQVADAFLEFFGNTDIHDRSASIQSALQMAGDR